MAFTIRLDNGKFIISTGDGSPVVARDVDEVHAAIDHYFGRERGDKDECPLCRWVHKERPKRKPAVAFGGDVAQRAAKRPPPEGRITHQECGCPILAPHTGEHGPLSIAP